MALASSAPAPGFYEDGICQVLPAWWALCSCQDCSLSGLCILCDERSDPKHAASRKHLQRLTQWRSSSVSHRVRHLLRYYDPHEVGLYRLAASSILIWFHLPIHLRCAVEPPLCFERDVECLRLSMGPVVWPLHHVITTEQFDRHIALLSAYLAWVSARAREAAAVLPSKLPSLYSLVEVRRLQWRNALGDALYQVFR